jgi:hypothetical protein
MISISTIGIGMATPAFIADVATITMSVVGGCRYLKAFLVTHGSVLASLRAWANPRGTLQKQCVLQRNQNGINLRK